MPHARRTFENFWNSTSPRQPNVLCDWLNDVGEFPETDACPAERPADSDEHDQNSKSAGRVGPIEQDDRLDGGTGLAPAATCGVFGSALLSLMLVMLLGLRILRTRAS